LIVDMTAEGVEIRPSGKADFNEVFLTDVRVDDRYRIAAPGQGWAVVTSNLEAERGLVRARPAPR